MESVSDMASDPVPDEAHYFSFAYIGETVRVFEGDTEVSSINMTELYSIINKYLEKNSKAIYNIIRTNQAGVVSTTLHIEL
jgi:hypothetical protein